MDLKGILGNNYNGSVEILDAFQKGDSIINNPDNKTIIVSVSGGRDSTICLDICKKLDVDNKCKYVFLDTGIEWGITKRFISRLEEKYEIDIIRTKPKKPIPQTVREDGAPFLSKFASECIGSLQSHGFTWEDISLEEMLKRGMPLGYSRWWCNAYEKKPGCEHLPKQFNIEYYPALKEWLMQNPPKFKISQKCCKYAKKSVSKHIIKEFNADVLVMGISRDENGIRSKSYKSCYLEKQDYKIWLPIFWFNSSIKTEYEEMFGVQQSELYCAPLNFKRSGCAGCPYNLQLEEDLEKIKSVEPNLYKGVCNIFHDSYEYTRGYREFKKKFKKELKQKEKDDSRKHELG